MSMWILAAVVAVTGGLVAWWLVRDCERSVRERLRRERLRRAMMSARPDLTSVAAAFEQMGRSVGLQLEPALRNLAREMSKMAATFAEVSKR